MKTTLRLQKAINISARQHDGQYRYGKDKFPYITHPFSVALIIAEWTNDEDIIIAGLFHDIFEDTKGYEYKQMADEFSDRVASIVKEVSEDEALPKEKRKMDRLERTKTSSDEALLVFMADKIHNAESLLAIKENGDDIELLKKFGVYESSELPKKDILALEIIKDRLPNHPGTIRLEEIYKKLISTKNN